MTPTDGIDKKLFFVSELSMVFARTLGDGQA